MRIGLDFDGVIADTYALKARIGREKFNVDIPLSHSKESQVIEKKLLTKEQYRELMAVVCGTRVGLEAPICEEADLYLRRLMDEGHSLIIITSRDEQESGIAREWCTAYNLELPLISVGYGVSKAKAVENFDVYLDDDLSKITPLVSVVPHRFLFNWEYNSNDDEGDIATRIHSWSDFYTAIKNLS